jgi:transcriptional regulator with XRE-family HTH domain
MNDVLEIRKALQLTRAQAALAIGKTVSTIGRWEQTGRLPWERSLQKYREALQNHAPSREVSQNMVFNRFTIPVVRKILCCSQEDFARRCGISLAYVKKLECNERRLTLELKNCIELDVKKYLVRVLGLKGAR